MADYLYVMGYLGDTPPVGSSVYNPNDLHITFINRGQIADTKLEDFMNRLRFITRWFDPMLITPAGADLLGPNKNIPAVLVKTHSELKNLENTLLTELDALGGTVSEIDIHGVGWLPHVTNWTNPEEATLTGVSLLWHRGGFGVDVVNLANYSFTE